MPVKFLAGDDSDDNDSDDNEEAKPKENLSYWKRLSNFNRRVSVSAKNAYKRGRSLARRASDKAKNAYKLGRRKFAKTKKYAKKYGRKAARMGSGALDVLARGSKYASDALASAGKSKSKGRDQKAAAQEVQPRAEEEAAGGGVPE